MKIDSILTQQSDIFIDYDNLNSTIKSLKITEKQLDEQILQGCNCGTDHLCDIKCELCLEICKKDLGHKDIHLCGDINHRCVQQCQYNSFCKNKCDLEIGHDGGHFCQISHQCKEQCKFCLFPCKYKIFEQHSIHECERNDNKCQFKCILCSNDCSNESHNHDDFAQSVYLKEIDPDSQLSDTKIRLHLCSKQHRCKFKCIELGICEIRYLQQIKKWVSNGSEIDYEFLEPLGEKIQCTKQIQIGNYSHSDHMCDQQHKCESQCPDCKSFCTKKYGHSKNELHTANHRNKDQIKVIKINENANLGLRDFNDQNIQFKVNDCLEAVNCIQYCKDFGRTHTHLIKCQGGDLCGEKDLTQQYCRHADDIEGSYDYYLCKQYWEKFDFQQPLISDLSSKCNAYCSKCLDSNNQPKYFCEQTSWHNNKKIPIRKQIHKINCLQNHEKEQQFEGIQIAFLLDTTSSMKVSLDSAKETIIKIAETIKQKLLTMDIISNEIQFGVVSYKDHLHPYNKENENVVQFNEFSNWDQTLQFIENLTAKGGGDNAEAVVDGLHYLNKLGWDGKKDKMIFHILDAPPHGKEFGCSSDNYKEGCPCKYQYPKILKELSNQNIKYYMIKLKSSLNTCFEIFQEIYGKTLFQEMKVQENLIFEISNNIQQIVVKILDQKIHAALK